MNLKIAVLSMLAALLFAGSFPSFAQATKEYPKDPDGNVIIYKDLPQEKLKLGRDYVRVAANVARSMNHESVNTYSAMFFHQENWADGQKDALFGPFLANQDPKMNRAAVIMFNSEQDDAVCVFFQDEVPYGGAMLAVKIGQPFDPKAIAAVYKPVTPDMDKEAGYTFKFIKSFIPLDDGTLVKSFFVTEMRTQQ